MVQHLLNCLFKGEVAVINHHCSFRNHQRRGLAGAVETVAFGDLIGMALGFAYFVVDNAALAMGNFGGYPPLIAAWAPFLLFLLIGQTVLIKTEE